MTRRCRRYGKSHLSSQVKVVNSVCIISKYVQIPQVVCVSLWLLDIAYCMYNPWSRDIASYKYSLWYLDIVYCMYSLWSLDVAYYMYNLWSLDIVYCIYSLWSIDIAYLMYSLCFLQVYVVIKTLSISQIFQTFNLRDSI